MSAKQLYIGLMSGTSIDGIDLALVDMSTGHPETIAHETYPYPPALSNLLHELCLPGDNEIDRMGEADIELAEVFADAVEDLLHSQKLSPADIVAIGSHGQTIRHRPDLNSPFTLQIGDPNTLAIKTGIDVVADFRRKDIALGGQGAPLVPAFHKALFSSSKKNRAIINIGGIANITWLPKDNGSILGFDTGPGNRLLDAWCERHTGKSFDENGQWAAQGSVNSQLLEKLLSHPYINQAFPKSTGREVFSINWVDESLALLEGNIEAEDVQRTLLEFTAQSITLHLEKLGKVEEVYICGGGAENPVLMNRLQTLLQPIKISSTNALNLPPETVEASAFAWLAYAHIHRIPGNVPSVTGARKEAILGGLYTAT